MENEKLLKLNDKQERFCREYIIDSNGSAAAIRAGYSIKTSRFIAFELLTKPHILKRIEELKADIFNTLGITQANIYGELKRIATADIRQLFDENGAMLPIHQIPDNLAAAIAGIESVDEKGYVGVITGTVRKVKLNDKLNAIAQLVKIGGWAAPDKLEHSGEINVITGMVVK